MNAVQHLPPPQNGPPSRPQNLGPVAAHERDDARPRNMAYPDSGHTSPMSPSGGSDFSLSRYQTSHDAFQSPMPQQLQPPPSRGNPATNNLSSGANNISNNTSPTTMGFAGGEDSGGSIPLANSGSTNSMARNRSQRSSGRSTSPRDSVILEHYEALKKYLLRHLAADSGKPSVRTMNVETYLLAEQLNQRQQKAREKLIRLSRTQFSELSTDVYDEIMRRQTTDSNNPSLVFFVLI